MPPSKNITFDELSKFFHLPINQVAKELGVCATILKKICRRNGIPRWPHRKIKSLDKMIDNLNRNLEKNPQERDDILREIELLKSKKLEIMKNPDILVIGKGLIPPPGVLGQEYLQRAFNSKMSAQSARPSSFGTSAQAKQIIDVDSNPNCFSSTHYFPDSKKEQPTQTPRYATITEEPKRVTHPLETKPSAEPFKQMPSDHFPFELPRLPAFTPHLNSPHTPNSQGVVPPPGVTHNFVVPSFEFQAYPPLDLPSLRFRDYENRYRSLHPMERTQSDSVVIPPLNTHLDSRPTFSIPSISPISQQAQHPVFPDWFSQEKDRIFKNKSQ